MAHSGAETGAPYQATISAVMALGQRRRGWDSYDADPVRPQAVSGALHVINNLMNLPERVPSPSVGALPDGALVLRWITPDREVDLILRGMLTGDYCVLDRHTDEILHEGGVEGLDILKDVVGRHVLGFGPRLSR